MNKLAAKYFYVQLKSERGSQAYSYLKNRELSDETITAFGLGFSNKYSDDLYKYLREKGYSEDLIRQAGLINTDERQGVYDKFWNRVMFPIMDVNNPCDRIWWPCDGRWETEISEFTGDSRF